MTNTDNRFHLCNGCLACWVPAGKYYCDECQRPARASAPTAKQSGNAGRNA